MMTCRKTLKLTSLVLISFSLAWPQSGLADEASISWQRDAEKNVKSGTGAGFSQDRLSVSVPVQTFRWHNDSVKASVKAQRTEFNWQGSSAQQDALYALSIPLSYHQWRGNNTELVAKLEPGLRASGTSFASKALKLDAELSARFYQSRQAYWQLGALVSGNFGDEKLYPLVAYAWKPNSVTEVKLGFPYSALYARWNNEMAGYLKVQPAGGLWVNTDTDGASGGTDNNPDGGDNNAGDGDNNVGDDDNNAGDNEQAPGDTSNTTSTTASTTDKTKYENWQLAAGTDIHWRDGFWFNVEAGYLFARKLTAPDAGGTAITARPDNSLYWQLGMKWQF